MGVTTASGAPAAPASSLVVRDAAEDDMPTVHAIYAEHVRHGTGSFEVAPPTLEEMARRRAEYVGRGMPYFVAEQDGRVVGFAYAAPHRPRAAYRYTVEDSVYVAPEALGRGVGSVLLDRLVAACIERGFRQMVAVIGDSQNRASIRLHEKAGFLHAGVLRSVGFKFGRWLDCVTMQRRLGDGDETTPPEGS